MGPLLLVPHQYRDRLSNTEVTKSDCDCDSGRDESHETSKRRTLQPSVIACSEAHEGIDQGRSKPSAIFQAVAFLGDGSQRNASLRHFNAGCLLPSRRRCRLCGPRVRHQKRRFPRLLSFSNRTAFRKTFCVIASSS